MTDEIDAGTENEKEVVGTPGGNEQAATATPDPSDSQHASESDLKENFLNQAKNGEAGEDEKPEEGEKAEEDKKLEELISRKPEQEDQAKKSDRSGAEAVKDSSADKDLSAEKKENGTTDEGSNKDG